MTIWIKIALLSFGLSFSVDPFDALSNAIREGKYWVISEEMDQSIELTLGNKSGLYTRNQAELLLKTFFRSHPPRMVSLTTKGNKGTDQFAIGKLSTADGSNYRLFILLREKDKELVIHEIRFQDY
jgi:hypothetical protein